MSSIAESSTTAAQRNRPLSLEEYKRYGRQMIMPGWGLPGQLKVKASKVAVIGAGGLGCPLLQYLAGAGVGTIGVIDHDTVDTSNLHRQILHTTERVGMNKAESASISLSALNPLVNIVLHDTAISPSNALDILRPYDIIVDCTDRPYTRYLLNDAAVLLDKPLVSGAAISNVGQWAVYAGDSTSGTRRACYRCMWPKVVGDGGGRCDEIGVWGPVVGLVGVAMAGEVLRTIIGTPEDQQTLHLYNMGGSPLVRSIKIRPPSVKCIACGPNKTIVDLEEYDYETFCSGTSGEATVQGVERIPVKAFADSSTGLDKGKRLVIDTRPPIEYEICSLPDTLNIPLDQILKSPDTIPPSDETIFICRRGNDSLVAAGRLRASLEQRRLKGEVKDVIGGLVAWSRDIDPEFPIY